MCDPAPTQGHRSTPVGCLWKIILGFVWIGGRLWNASEVPLSFLTGMSLPVIVQLRVQVLTGVRQILLNF